MTDPNPEWIDAMTGHTDRATAAKALADKATPEDTDDEVNHPPHYLAHPSGIECIQVTEHFNFNVGNAIKYLWRTDEKDDPITNLLKAAWYIRREIERREGGA